MANTEPRTDSFYESLTSEISLGLQTTYEQKRDDIIYQLGCGDDRHLTAESQAALVEAGADPTEAFLRYYGGLAGVARVLALTLITQRQADELAQLGTTFTALMKTVKSHVEATSMVRLELHTAEANEGNAREFMPDAEGNVGCAYASSLAIVANICATSQPHRELTLIEQSRLFGESVATDAIIDANQHFVRQYFGDASVTGLSRHDYVDVDTPVQVLAGSHAAPADTCAVINFTTGQVSNPHQAATPFYNNDVTQVAEMLIRAYPTFHLQPKVLLAVMDQDIRATRAALDPEQDAAHVAQVRLGEPVEALRHLRAVQDSLAS